MAKAPVFYLGTHMDGWLAHVGVPLFVSHRRLARRKTLPKAALPVASHSALHILISRCTPSVLAEIDQVRALWRTGRCRK